MCPAGWKEREGQGYAWSLDFAPPEDAGATVRGVLRGDTEAGGWVGGSGGDTANAAALDGISTRTEESVGLISLFRTVIDDSPNK